MVLLFTGTCTHLVPIVFKHDPVNNLWNIRLTMRYRSTLSFLIGKTS